MSIQITHVDPEEKIRRLKARVARLEKALANSIESNQPMATYNSDDRKADLMVIGVCVGISIAIAVMAYFGWLPGGV